jgi:coenzyme F420-0:L-glutamate ligase/coenzyme F420-1:gamma-L-glutamate ligase
MSVGLSLVALEGLPHVRPGDDLAGLLIQACLAQHLHLVDGEILVVAQKIVSKAEGRVIDLATVEPSPFARRVADEVAKDPRLVQVILGESEEVIRTRKDVLVVAHRRGFVMANAGVDQSNVGAGGAESVLLLPCDPDLSAARLKARLDVAFSANVGVIVNDSCGRPFRNGVVSLALGAAGVPSLWSLVGAPDLFGRPMRVTEVAVADQLASAASLVMGEADEGRPAVLVRGFACGAPPVPASALVRPKAMDLFR